ncbi:MAG: hypothetical protein IT560_14320, partial [Alphaproteobacteria bacterium]|nr:hypothetical protein [Alphaproteobacteria bacterium]
MTDNDETEAVQAQIDRATGGSVIEFTGSAAIRQLLLKGLKNVTLSNLNINVAGLPTQAVPNHGPAVVLLDGCENVTLNNC